MKKTRENIKYILFKVLYIIIIPIILYDILIIASSIINPYKTPSFFGIKTFTIISGSMMPTINVDDVVIVKEINPWEIQIDDIVSFKTDNEIVTHRVINIETKNGVTIFTTQGDNNDVTDLENIEFYQIEGKMIGKIPKIGKILNLLKNKIVFITTIIFLILGFVFQKKKITNKIRRSEKREKWDLKNGNLNK